MKPTSIKKSASLADPPCNARGELFSADAGTRLKDRRKRRTFSFCPGPLCIANKIARRERPPRATAHAAAKEAAVEGAKQIHGQAISVIVKAKE
jgi:hypothetical protein